MKTFFFSSTPKDIFNWFFEREGDREREKEKMRNVDVKENINWPPPLRILTRNRTHNPFGLWEDTPANWATQLGSLSLRLGNFTRLCLRKDHSILYGDTGMWISFHYVDSNVLFWNISVNYIFMYLFFCIYNTMLSLLGTPVMNMYISFAYLCYLLFSL